MFFKIKSPSPILSWAISKNPNGALFVRSLSAKGDDSRRIVEGKFSNVLEYSFTVKNDGLKFLATMREENKDSYVAAEKYIVCPYNLQGFNEVFKSAIRGTNDSKGTISDEELFAPLDLEAEIGPFLNKSNIEVFENAGISASWLETQTSEVGVLKLTTKSPLSISEFLRKIYVISAALTSHIDWNITDGNKIDKFIALGKGWLETHPDKEYIIKKLSGYKRDFQNKLNKGLAEEKENTEVEIEENTSEETLKTKIEKTETVTFSDPNNNIISLTSNNKDFPIDESISKSNLDGFELLPKPKIRLHELRHDIICGIVKEAISADPDLNDNCGILDLGSGEGKLISKLLDVASEIHITALECVVSKIYKIQDQFKTRGKLNPRVEFQHDNILYPRNLEKLRDNQIVVLSEVIEHFNKEDRKHLLTLVRDVLMPDYIILTTPNSETNIEMGLVNEDGTVKFRHNDHKIEYTPEQFNDQVVKFLEKKYDVELIKFETGYSTQPSFILKAAIKDNTTKFKIPATFTRIHESIYISSVDFGITPKEMLWGLTSNSFVQNANQVFWLGGTIAPCDYSEKAPEYLEHPQGVFDYYLSKGVTQLIEEPKWMGSRAYVAAFKTIEVAKKFGFDELIIVNSRNGYTFFKDEKGLAFKNTMYQEILEVFEKQNLEFIMMDGEMLPWNYKAEELIQKKFVRPGEAALIYRLNTGDSEENVSNANEFLKELSEYSKNEELCFRPFHLLAAGNLEKYVNFTQCTHEYQLSILNGWFEIGKLIRTMNVYHIDSRDLNAHVIRLGNEYEKEKSINRWEKFTNEGGEGFVYKTTAFTQYYSEGRPICPMMKCRGKNYLRLIYGIDYLEKEYFAQLLKNRKRNIKMKRELSVYEHMLSLEILKTTLNKNHTERLRMIAGFFGYDEFKSQKIDATL